MGVGRGEGVGRGGARAGFVVVVRDRVVLSYETGLLLAGSSGGKGPVIPEEAS